MRSCALAGQGLDVSYNSSGVTVTVIPQARVDAGQCLWQVHNGASSCYTAHRSLHLCACGLHAGDRVAWCRCPGTEALPGGRSRGPHHGPSQGSLGGVQKASCRSGGAHPAISPTIRIPRAMASLLPSCCISLTRLVFILDINVHMHAPWARRSTGRRVALPTRSASSCQNGHSQGLQQTWAAKPGFGTTTRQTTTARCSSSVWAALATGASGSAA